MAAELVALPLTLAAQRLILSLKELQSKKQDNPTIVQEIDKFITSLHGDIDLVKKKLPMKSSSWAFDSLETDLNEAASFLEDGLKNGNLKKFSDTKRTSDELETLRTNLADKFQVKLFISILEVVIGADGKVDNFESRMLKLSTLSAAEARAESRKLLQPLVVGMRGQEERIQSFISEVRENEAKVHISAEAQTFLAAVLANLEELTGDETGERSSTTPTPPEDTDKFLDPITKQLMNDPVKCTDGVTYDRFSVFQRNLTHKQPLVIASDDLELRRELFEKFRAEGVEANFRNVRKSYRDEALVLAQEGDRKKALTMLENVVQWAPEDSWCQELRDQLKAQNRQAKGSKIVHGCGISCVSFPHSMFRNSRRRMEDAKDTAE